MEDETEEYVESTEISLEEISPEEISPEERAVEPPERALCRALNGPVSRRRLPRWLLDTVLRCRLRVVCFQIWIMRFQIRIVLSLLLRPGVRFTRGTARGTPALRRPRMRVEG